MVRRRVLGRVMVSVTAVCAGVSATSSVSATDDPPPPGQTGGGGPVVVPARPYDFDGDGYAELLIGQRFDPSGFWVIAGSWLGPSLTTADQWTSSSPGLGTTGGAMEWGYASGDFDGDGYADVAASSLATGPYGSPTYRSGAIRVLYGSSAGLSSVRSQAWSQDTAGIADVAEPDDAFGTALATGDVDGDGFDDLVVGVPGEDVGTIVDAGALHVLYGSATGLAASGSQMWTQDSGGVPDVAEAGDSFGAPVIVADVTADGVDDVVIGVPSESIGAEEDAGAVMVLRGSTSAVTSLGAQHWTQDAAGIATVASAGDRFGARVVAGDFGGGPEYELAVSAFGEAAAVRAGEADPSSRSVVQVLSGTPTGLTGVGSQSWSQASPGIAESPELSETFGRQLAAGDIDGDGYDELAIAVDEYLDGVGGLGFDVDGAVHVLFGGSSGLTATGSELWHQAVAGVPGVARGDDEFGWDLQMLDLDGDGRAELAAGSRRDWAPRERGLGEVEQAGTVNLFRGTTTGLTTSGAQLWYRGAYGIGGPPGEHDNFGILGT